MSKDQIAALPDNISLDQIKAIYEILGVDWKDAIELRIGLRAVEVVIYACIGCDHHPDTDQHARYFPAMMDNDAATHSVMIPIIRDPGKTALAGEVCP